MEEALQQYFTTPSGENFLSLQEMMAASTAYAPYSDYEKSLEHDVEQEDYQSAVEHLLSLSPGWMLNPGFHLTLSFLYHKLGQEQDAEVELSLAHLFVEGIISTGDGTKSKPYIVLSPKDEYDVLGYFKKTPQQQALIEEAEKQYDMITCQDGRELWFDVTRPYSTLQQTKMRDRE